MPMVSRTASPLFSVTMTRSVGDAPPTEIDLVISWENLSHLERDGGRITLVYRRGRRTWDKVLESSGEENAAKLFLSLYEGWEDWLLAKAGLPPGTEEVEAPAPSTQKPLDDSYEAIFARLGKIERVLARMAQKLEIEAVLIEGKISVEEVLKKKAEAARANPGFASCGSCGQSLAEDWRKGKGEKWRSCAECGQALPEDTTPPPAAP